MKLRSVRLGEVINDFNSLRKPIKSTDRVSGVYPYYGASGVVDHVDDYIFDGDYLLIAEDGENLRSRSTPIAFLASGKFWVNNHAHVVRGNDLADTRYLNYLLATTDISGYLTGSAQPKLNKASMESILLSLPDLKTQQAIAEVLGALDDKIAANTRIAENLNELFSAHWRALDSSSESALITVESLLGEKIGGDWGTAESTESAPNEVYCIRGADITDLQQAGLGKMPRRFLKTKSLERRKLKDGDLVVELSGGSPTQSTGRAVLVTDALLNRLALPLTSSNFCRIVRPKDPELSFYLYGLLQTSWRRGEFFSFENGSTGIKNLAFADYCADKAVSLPDNESLKQFNQLAQSIFKLMHSLGAESSQLAATRDALLPQLMSGKLRVRDAEEVVENVL